MKKKYKIVVRLVNLEEGNRQPLSNAARRYHAYKYILAEGKAIELPDFPGYYPKTIEFLKKNGINEGQWTWDGMSMRECWDNMRADDDTRIVRWNNCDNSFLENTDKILSKYPELDDADRLE